MTKTFRPYSLDQQLLLPPDMRGWLPEGDLALFVSDVVDALDLAAIYAAYESGEGRGQPPYHPASPIRSRASWSMAPRRSSCRGTTRKRPSMARRR